MNSSDRSAVQHKRPSRTMPGTDLPVEHPSPWQELIIAQLLETVMPVLAPGQLARDQLWAYARDDRL
jgi:hypothetical protein